MHTSCRSPAHGNAVGALNVTDTTTETMYSVATVSITYTAYDLTKTHLYPHTYARAHTHTYTHTAISIHARMYVHALLLPNAMHRRKRLHALIR